jgi:mono/diheme cytochrome c family protein
LSNRSLRPVYALVLMAVAFSTGCWEQWSESWFPQMKWQPAVQAFSAPKFPDDRQLPFGQPAGTVSVTGELPWEGQLDPWVGRPDAKPSSDDAANALVNPRPADFASLQNGQVKYLTYCSPCHGTTGLGNGPVSATGGGPFAGVLPVVGVVKARSDGHIYTTIRQGRRRMPPYTRIPSDDRWDIVNYVRYLDQRGGRP